jgi:hypothetical protein
MLQQAIAHLGIVCQVAAALVAAAQPAEVCLQLRKLRCILRLCCCQRHLCFCCCKHLCILDSTVPAAVNSHTKALLQTTLWRLLLPGFSMSALFYFTF